MGLPVAEVLDETARVVRAAGDLGAGTRRGDVVVDPLPQQFDHVGAQHAAQADRSVAGEILGVGF
jgi:hypothetical protein